MTIFSRFTAKPGKLPDWPKGSPVPQFDHAYLITINNFNLKNMDVTIRRRTTQIPAEQSKLTMDFIIRNLNEWTVMPLATSTNGEGSKLDLALKTDNGLLIFHLVDQEVDFLGDNMDEPTFAVVKALDIPDYLFNAKWVPGLEKPRAVSVIISGKTEPEPTIFGLGLVIREGASYKTPIFVDPKIQNDGND